MTHTFAPEFNINWERFHDGRDSVSRRSAEVPDKVLIKDIEYMEEWIERVTGHLSKLYGHLDKFEEELKSRRDGRRDQMANAIFGAVYNFLDSDCRQAVDRALEIQ